MNRVLVTGGAGFIGSHLTEHLIRAGYQVAVVDDLSTGQKSNIPKTVSWRKLDVRTQAFRSLVRDWRPDYICHLAAQLSVVDSVREPTKDASVNILGTVNTLAAAAGRSLKKFLFVSTAAVYGQAREIPTPEDSDLQLNSPYAVSKYSAEQYLSLFESNGQLPAVIVRLSNVYGPRQRYSGEGGVAAKFAAAVLSNKKLVIEGRGEQTRDFLYVSDAVQGLIIAMEKGRGIYNLSTGQEISIRELAVKIGEVAGTVPNVTYAPARPNDVKRSSLSPIRAKRDLGWQAQTPLTDGLRQTLKWFKEIL